MQNVKKMFFTHRFFTIFIVCSTILSTNIFLVNSIFAAVNKLEQAITLHDAGRNGNMQATADAIKLLETIIESEPTNVKALAYLGSSYALTARDSKKIADRIRYSNRGLRFLDKAISIDPNYFIARVIRAKVTNRLPSMFGRKETAIEDGLMLDQIFSTTQSPKMAASMVDIYIMLSEITDGQEGWTNKANWARQLAELE